MRRLQSSCTQNSLYRVLQPPRGGFLHTTLKSVQYPSYLDASCILDYYGGAKLLQLEAPVMASDSIDLICFQKPNGLFLSQLAQ